MSKTYLMLVADCRAPSKLIVVDMSPAKGPISAEFANYIDAMRRVGQDIKDGKIKTKKEADAQLQSVEPVSRNHS